MLVSSLLTALIILLLAGLAGVFLFCCSIYGRPYLQEDDWRFSRKQCRQEPPACIWLQFYQTGTPRVTWTSLDFLASHDDVKYIRVDLVREKSDGT